ncbi:hypothetical protein [Halovulum sp. GXIMD14793]
MTWLIYTGTGLALLGLAGIIFCIIKARQSRDLDDQEAFRAAMQKVLVVNMASLAIAVLGLMVMVVGLLF